MEETGGNGVKRVETVEINLDVNGNPLLPKKLCKSEKSYI
jgi:hypothetical protein